jgi:bacteriocin biosynthesis cyclodehydratase domain-containing protein
MRSRPALAPGLRVLERGRDRVQIGLSTGHRQLFDVDPGMRRVLAALDRGEAVPTDPRSRAAVARLHPVLFAADHLAPSGVAPGDAAALALRDRLGYADRLERRRSTRLLVHDDLAGPVDPVVLLEAAGFSAVARNPAGTARPDAALVLVTAEPDRSLLDPWIRDGTPHLLVRAVEGELVVGPLVVPGATACLRCIDAHHAVDDPLYPVLVTRHHAAARSDGIAEPVDSALAAIAIGWAVRDLTGHLDGEEVTTWSSTVRFGPEPGEVSVITWLRDPGCGCAWLGSTGSGRSDRSDTMEP